MSQLVFSAASVDPVEADASHIVTALLARAPDFWLLAWYFLPACLLFGLVAAGWCANSHRRRFTLHAWLVWTAWLFGVLVAVDWLLLAAVPAASQFSAISATFVWLLPLVIVSVVLDFLLYVVAEMVWDITRMAWLGVAHLYRLFAAHSVRISRNSHI